MNTAKIVYYGPGLSGKTTSLAWLLAQPALRGRRCDRPGNCYGSVELPDIPLRLELYVPAMSLFNDPSRPATLRGADGIVFVVDPQEPRLAASLEALENLTRYLALDGRRLVDLPMALQYNKRDLPGASLAELDTMFNRAGRPRVESIATRGVGVLAALESLARQLTAA